MSSSQTELPLPTSPPVWAPRRTSPARPVLLRWPVVAPAVLAVVLMTGYLLLSRIGAAAPVADIQRFGVEPRSFPVLLQEKGELKAAVSIDIRCELEGKSTIIYLIEEGAHVQKGDLLVELASETIDENIRNEEIKSATALAAYEASLKEREILKDENASNLRKADLALQMAELGLRKFDEGDRVQLKQDAVLALEKAKSVLERSQDYLKDSEALFQQKYITRNDLENDRFKAYEAQIELKKAQVSLDVLEKYTFPMDLREKQSAVDEAAKELERTRKSTTASEAKSDADVAAKKAELDLVQEKLAKLRDQKTKAKIYAPEAGLVVYARSDRWYRSETEIQTGAQVIERQLLIQLPDTKSMKVVIRVHEAQTEYLKIGLPTGVEIEGFTGRQFNGKVSKIAVLADSQNRWLNPNLKQYETEVLLEGAFTDLKPGTTARVQVQLAHLENVLAVPVQAIFAKNSKYYVFLDDAGIQPAEVQIGMASNEYVEIKNGLAAGQFVRLAINEEMKLMLPDGEDKSAAPKAGASERVN